MQNGNNPWNMRQALIFPCQGRWLIILPFEMAAFKPGSVGLLYWLVKGFLGAVHWGVWLIEGGCLLTWEVAGSGTLRHLRARLYIALDWQGWQACVKSSIP